MHALLRTADAVLRRGARSTAPEASPPTLPRLLLCVLAFGGFYGVVMGLYRTLNGQPDGALQALYSASKTPLLILGSFVIGLPVFFVLSTLLGLRRDFGRSVRALISAQAATAIALAALAPVTLLFYLSTADYQQALLFNGVCFAVASCAGQAVLRGHFRPLIARNPRHRGLLVGWAIAYLFVAVQLAWLLRPFIGSGLRVTVFRPEAWDNAYVVVVRLVWSLFTGD
ncbi:hypothetical protein MalM25_37290 [Planctomycetes bacterium MalM25]|nr:hypothetical protein MalM25_37290 [Planctomycetes bacterium MalM25]